MKVVTDDFSIFEFIQGLFLVDYPAFHGKAGFSNGCSNECQLPGFFQCVVRQECVMLCGNCAVKFSVSPWNRELC